SITVGSTSRVVVSLSNESWAPLYGLEIEPYGADALEFGEGEESFELPPLGSARTDLVVSARRTGRWMLHGFDTWMTDPLGLVRACDYLPSNFAFEAFPRIVGQRRAGRARNLGVFQLERGGRHLVRHIGSGSVVRELRDYQPGDPLRHIAWKTTAKKRRLIARDFEREVRLSMYLLLDISTSMRGGQRRGQKLEHGIEAVAEIAKSVIEARDRVGLMTFDEKLYGHVPPSVSPGQLTRILQHLVGVNSVVDPDLTEWDESQLVEKVCDYLVVQDRLDFRQGNAAQEDSEIDRTLLERWLEPTVRREERKLDSPSLQRGVFESDVSLVRRFAQLRGIEVPYRVEARLGLKERGLGQALDTIVETTRETQWIVVISDLCGIVNDEIVTRWVRLAQHQGHSLCVLAPFTPAYYDDPAADSERVRVVREVFGAREREQRLEVASHLRSLGVPVHFIKPGQSALDILTRSDVGTARAPTG
ncbi:MAG: DUF58 domain-containing protein, partial [Persicimonas sp.]